MKIEAFENLINREQETNKLKLILYSISNNIYIYFKLKIKLYNFLDYVKLEILNYKNF